LRIRRPASGIAFLIAAIFILGWGLIAMFVLLYSFLHGKEPPSWAVSLESATVTATIAMLFKDHLPSIELPSRKPK
jgi:heme/copper-type cytochrome/quinol oxidase subunit 4